MKKVKSKSESKFEKEGSRNIKLSIFNPRDVLYFSSGEIKNPETLNYKTLKPVEEGLFCNKIFGTKDNFCNCGKFYEYSSDIKSCNICGVEIIKNKLKRNKIGHIKLNEDFINLMFFKTYPKFLTLILNLSVFEIENILYNDYYLVFYSDIKNIKINDIINSKVYFYYFKKYNNKIYAETGFKAIKTYLSFIDFDDEIEKLRFFFKNNKDYSDSLYIKNLKKFNLIKKFRKFNNPESLLIRNLPVLHPSLRPIVKLSDETVVSSDLNVLYKKIITRNNRLEYLKKNYFYDSIYSNELKNTQESIDNLFNNSSCINKSIDNNKRTLKSIADNLRGKRGLFRNNILGKRVDYSGRSVITSGPNLKLDECAIPIDMALELFRPFIYNKILSQKKYNFNINDAKLQVDKKTNFAVKMLFEVVKNNFVLLNRAPTLHKLSMQSFRILLTEDKAIKLNPLVCVGFNADFDGDQMAVHIPLTIKTRLEYKEVLISTNNILHPANGECVIAPTKDIVLGLYYYTNIVYIENPMIFSDLNSLKAAYSSGLINLNTRIFIRLKEFISDNEYNDNFYETNMARYLLFDILPKYLPYNLINRVLRKKDIIFVLNFIYFKFGPNSVVEFSNKLMSLGFNFATNSGISISIDDLLVDENKYKIIYEANNILHLYNVQYSEGELSYVNRRKKILNLWETVYEIISNNCIRKLFYNKKFLINNSFVNNNSLFYMADSGARGSETQLKQICGMRGFINNKDKGISEIPIISNLKEGLNVLEYFYFSYNSRKVLADTALKTSNSGYLTRKLVESVNNVKIFEYDCFTEKGINFKNLVYNNILIEGFYDRLLGRFISKNLFDNDNNLIIKKSTLIDNSNIHLIKNLNIDFLEMRSPITCESKKGVCSVCYGLNLNNNLLTNIGETIGIIAAQSIGEPGTQLTMRTFHTGGVINKSLLENIVKSNYNGRLKYSSSLKVVINNGEKIVISKIGKVKIVNINDKELCSLNIPYSSTIFFDDNSLINSNDIICRWDIENELVLSDQDGYLVFENFFENLNYIKTIKNNKIIFEILDFSRYNESYLPSIKVCKTLENINKNFYKYDLVPGSQVLFVDKEFVKAGDILIKNYISNDKIVDIIGGLPKVVELFEARVPKNPALLSPVDGLVKIKYTKNNYKNIYIYNNNNELIFKKKFSPKYKILVENNQVVNKGDILINGTLNPHDILRIYGKEELIYFLISEIKSVYFAQGIKINDKHIEVIIKQMLSKCRITDPGRSNFIIGDIFDIKKILKLNKLRYTSFFSSIKFEVILSGITKISSTSKSFLSSVSFQNTLSVLSASSVSLKENKINTLKEYIMLGRPLDIGMGYYNKILLKRKCQQ